MKTEQKIVTAYANYIDRLNEGKTIGEKIIDRFSYHNVDLSVKEMELLCNAFKYRIKLSKNSCYCDLKKFAEDVRLNIKLRYLRIVIENDVDIWIIASINKVNQHLNLFDVLINSDFKKFRSQFTLAHPIGVDEMGNVIVKDLALYPHLLIAGTTGSGKTTAVKALIITLLYQYNPSEVNLILSDPSGDLLPFNDFPHLSCPVITQFDGFYLALQQLYEEMKRRIKLKETAEFKQLPYILLIADEFISMITGKDPEKKEARTIFQQILRMGRHAKICIVAVAFNPTAKNLNLDAADLPTRMAFKVAKCSNSMAVIGCGGAEKLSGNGDMLFQSSQGDGLQRIQGFDVPSPKKLTSILKKKKIFWLVNQCPSQYFFHIDLARRELLTDLPIKDTKPKSDNKRLAAIILWALSQDSISSNEMMKTFNLGWNNSQKFMAELEKIGIIGDLRAKLPRTVLIDSYGDIPTDVQSFLLKNGYSPDDINKALDNKRE